MTDFPPVIQINAYPDFFRDLAAFLKANGLRRTEEYLKEQGASPAFIKAAIKRCLRRNQW